MRCGCLIGGDMAVRKVEILALTERAREVLDEAEKCEVEAARVDNDPQRRQELLTEARVYRLTADELASVALEFAQR